MKAVHETRAVGLDDVEGKGKRLVRGCCICEEDREEGVGELSCNGRRWGVLSP